MDKRLIWYFLIPLMILLSFFISQAGYPKDRCEDYIVDVRIEHTKQFGIQYPYWYGIGQLRQESACRSSVTAFDAGQGVAQFMPATSKYVQSLMGQVLDPYNPQHAIRMQAFYMRNLHKQNFSIDKQLWITYQGYNGGFTLLKKEYIRAGLIDWNLMKLQCQRKKIVMKWGVLDLCEVNYDYSQRISKYGNLYRRGKDGYKFW